MIKKLFLVLLIVAGATATIPPLRELAAPHVGPLYDEVVGWWMVRLRPVLDPVFQWSAKNELRRIALDLRERASTFRPLPDPAQFEAYLRNQTHTGRGGRDPGGVPYRLVLTRDSIYVSSAGPDRKHGTADDVRVVVPRR